MAFFIRQRRVHLGQGRKRFDIIPDVLQEVTIDGKIKLKRTLSRRDSEAIINAEGTLRAKRGLELPSFAQPIEIYTISDGQIPPQTETVRVRPGKRSGLHQLREHIQQTRGERSVNVIVDN